MNIRRQTKPVKDKRRPCTLCLSTLDPNDADESLQAIVQCTECNALYHHKHWKMLDTGCIKRRSNGVPCGSTSIKQVRVPPPPVLDGNDVEAIRFEGIRRAKPKPKPVITPEPEPQQSAPQQPKPIPADDFGFDDSGFDDFGDFDDDFFAAPKPKPTPQPQVTTPQPSPQPVKAATVPSQPAPPMQVARPSQPVSGTSSTTKSLPRRITQRSLKVIAGLILMAAGFYLSLMLFHYYMYDVIANDPIRDVSNWVDGINRLWARGGIQGLQPLVSSYVTYVAIAFPVAVYVFFPHVLPDRSGEPSRARRIIRLIGAADLLYLAFVGLLSSRFASSIETRNLLNATAAIFIIVFIASLIFRLITSTPEIPVPKPRGLRKLLLRIWYYAFVALLAIIVFTILIYDAQNMMATSALADIATLPYAAITLLAIMASISIFYWSPEHKSDYVANLVWLRGLIIVVAVITLFVYSQHSLFTDWILPQYFLSFLFILFFLPIQRAFS